MVICAPDVADHTLHALEIDGALHMEHVAEGRIATLGAAQRLEAHIVRLTWCIGERGLSGSLSDAHI